MLSVLVNDLFGASMSGGSLGGGTRARGRDEFKGILWWNQRHLTKSFDPATVGSSCRFMCYPYKDLRNWTEGSKKGSTVVIIFEIPEKALETLCCRLQLICAPFTANDPVWSSRSKIIQGSVVKLPVGAEAGVPPGLTAAITF